MNLNTYYDLQYKNTLYREFPYVTFVKKIFFVLLLFAKLLLQIKVVYIEAKQ